MVSAVPDEVANGAVLATLGAPPQEASAKATAAHATAITAARERAGTAYPGHNVGWAGGGGVVVLTGPPVSCRCARGGQGAARSAKSATTRWRRPRNSGRTPCRE